MASGTLVLMRAFLPHHRSLPRDVEQAALIIAVLGCALLNPEQKEQADEDWSRADGNDSVRPQ